MLWGWLAPRYKEQGKLVYIYIMCTMSVQINMDVQSPV